MASIEEVDFDDNLIALSKKIPGHTIDELGKELGFDAVEIERYSRYKNDTCNGTLEMLRDWHKKRTKTAALKNALMNTGLVRLVPELFPIGGTGLLSSINDFDDMLVTVAKRVRGLTEINTLGMKLGFTQGDIHRYIETNHKTQTVTYYGTLKMLRDWRKGQIKSNERGALKNALEQSGQIRLADDLFLSSQ